MFDLQSSESDFTIENQDGTIAETAPMVPKMGAGRCNNCTCTAYSNARTGNDYCMCGHAYSDHW